MASIEQTTHIDMQLEIVRLYAEGLSLDKVAARLGVNKSTVSKWVKRHGGSIRPAKESRLVYGCDNTVFQQTTPDSLYWLGFLIAGGCVVQKPNRSLSLTVELQSGDESHLIELRRFLQTKAPIRKDETHSAVVLSVTSDKLCQSLIKRGCHSNKSLTAYYPPSGHFHPRHFIRGYFDGDGSIYNDESRYRQTKVSFAGTIDFLVGIQDVLHQDAGMSINKLYHHSSKCFAILAWSGRGNVRKLYDYLYGEGGVCLERKKQRFEHSLSYGQ